MSDTPVPPILEWFAEWKVQGQLKLSRLAKKVAAIPLVQTVAEQAVTAFSTVKTSLTNLTAAPISAPPPTFRVPGERRDAAIALQAPSAGAPRKFSIAARQPLSLPTACSDAPLAHPSESAEDKMRFLQEQLAFLKAQMDAMMQAGSTMALAPAASVCATACDAETPNDCGTTPDGDDATTPDDDDSHALASPRKVETAYKSVAFASPVRAVPGTPNVQLVSPPRSVLKNARKAPGSAVAAVSSTSTAATAAAVSSASAQDALLFQSPPRSSSIGRGGDELIPGAPLSSARGPGAPLHLFVSSSSSSYSSSSSAASAASAASAPVCGPPVPTGPLTLGPPCMPPSSRSTGPTCMPLSTLNGPPCMPPGAAASPPTGTLANPVSTTISDACASSSAVRRPSASDLMAAGQRLRTNDSSSGNSIGAGNVKMPPVRGPLSSGNFAASLAAATAAKSASSKSSSSVAASSAFMPASSTVLQPRSASLPSNSSAAVQLPGGLKVFTRKLLADDEVVDFATEIKISAKMKLRRVPNQQRSPGGTPMRQPGDFVSPDKDSFRKALMSKFKNTRDESAQLKSFASSANADGAKRLSLGKRLDEERARTQSEVTEGEWECGDDKENAGM